MAFIEILDMIFKIVIGLIIVGALSFIGLIALVIYLLVN